MERLRTLGDLMETLREQERFVAEQKARDRVVAEEKALQSEFFASSFCLLPSFFRAPVFDYCGSHPLGRFTA